MNIDARNLFLNSLTAKNPKVSTPSQAKTEELVRNLDKADESLVIKQDTLRSIIAQSASKTDGFAEYTSGLIPGSAFKRIDILSAYEQDYTAEDALNNCWFSSTQNSLFDLCGTTAKVTDDAVAGMDKDEFLAYVRENGLDKEIVWSGISASFGGGTDCYTFSDYSDYAGALYASLEERIMRDFSGEEQAQQLEKLDNIFNEKVDGIVEQYFKGAIETFDKMGIELSEDDLKESLRSIMLNKRDAYRDYVKENSDYAGLEGSEDKWLERDTLYMANALRNAYKPDSVSSGKYSEDDLMMVSLMGEMYQFDTEINNSLSYNDEESIGLAIAMNYLTLQSSFDSFELSDDIKAMGEAAFAKYAKNLVDGVEASLERGRNRPLGYSSEQFDPLNMDDIKAVVDVMVKTYQESKDAEKAIYATTSFAHQQFTNKQNDEQYSNLLRYGSSRFGQQGGKFWNNFYDSGKGSSNIGRLIEKWNTYAQALSDRDIKTLYFNSSTRVYHSYGQTIVHDTPLVGGYANGEYWGFNLEEYVFGNKE